MIDIDNAIVNDHCKRETENVHFNQKMVNNNNCSIIAFEFDQLSKPISCGKFANFPIIYFTCTRHTTKTVKKSLQKSDESIWHHLRFSF